MADQTSPQPAAAPAQEPKFATVSAFTTYGGVAVVLSGVWTGISKFIKDLDPKWSLLVGAVGALLLTAASEPLDPRYTGWRRPVLYVGLFALNTIILASAAIGVEETADQGTDKAADN